MKAYLARWREWFNALAPRERWLTGAGGITAVFTLSYLLVWDPLVSAHSSREEALNNARALAQRLEQVGADAQRNRGGGGGAINRSVSLLSAVDQAAKSGSLGKAPSRLQAEGDKEVKVWIEDVSFDGLLRWIMELQTRQGIVVQTADIEKESAPGLVNARLSLVRP